MVRFKVGHKYGAFDSGIDPILVIRRTEKFITVKGSSGNEWRMKIREYENKNGHWYECAVDRSVPARWRSEYTYCTYFEEE